MSDISVSERRLSAALDRIDQLLEAGTGRTSAADAAALAQLQARLDGLSAENAGLMAEIEALRARPAPEVRDHDREASRLDVSPEQAARLSAANEQLAAANRALIEAASGSGDIDRATREALEAEIEALRAARAAEIGQLSEIMIELERVLAEEPAMDHIQPAAAPPTAIEDAVLPEVVGDGAGVPEADPSGGIAHDAAPMRAEGHDGGNR